MTDLRKMWAIAQRSPNPLPSLREFRRVIPGYKAPYADLVAALPRPMNVCSAACGGWEAFCLMCFRSVAINPHLRWTHDDAVEHLHDAHGCPSRKATGEPCDPQCIHCHGWQWCAEPNERREP